ncbi:MAG: glycosyltransferase family 4 protein [Chloroflexi bacterium]|nr:glycosyltransferase family 4 protein [Chloroflexota bacterium]
MGARLATNILICATQVPFVHGGAEVLVGGLKEALQSRGFRTDVVSLPYNWQPKSEIFRSLMAWRLLDIRESNGIPVDRVICTKFPSYAVRHPHKVVWLVHQHRQAYDWYGTGYSDFLNTPADRRVRKLIKSSDRRTLLEAERIFAISGNVSARLKKYNQLTSEVLYPPPANPHLGESGIGDFVLFVGRLDRAKRVELLLEAAKLAGGGIQYVIAGAGPERRMLEDKAVRLGIDDRVRFAGFLPDEEIAGLYAGCRAVVYTPVDEDYGYAAVEAFFSAKPVITSSDSGGVLEFVRDGETGIVAESNPAALAGAIARLASNSNLASQLGCAGLASVRHITWENVIERLTA